MPANQRRYAQAVPVVYICIFIAVLIWAATFCIRVLMLKQQAKQGAEQLAGLRRKISAANTSNESLRTKKEQLTSITSLKKAIADGVIKLKPIDDSAPVVIVSAVRVAASAPLVSAEEGR